MRPEIRADQEDPFVKKTKKYLVLGAAGLGLIALLANPGCSVRRTGWVEEDGQYS